MASGLDVAAFAAQGVSIAFQAFQGCIDGYKLCHDARRMSRDSDLLRAKLQIEKGRLLAWASAVKLDTPNPEHNLNWAEIVDILEQQESILTSGDKLRRKYNLKVPEEVVGGDDEKSSVEDVQGVELTEPTSGLTRLLRNLRPALYDKTGAKAKAGKGTVGTQIGITRRIKWAAIGKEALTAVIHELDSLNTELERQLDTSR